jgi:hypothetical protein
MIAQFVLAILRMLKMVLIYCIKIQYSPMPFRPPLTREQLRAIQDRNPGSSDVRELLWEVSRLRARVLRADQLQRSIGDTLPYGAGVILDCLRNEIRDEPCIAEDEGRRVEILGKGAANRRRE